MEIKFRTTLLSKRRSVLRFIMRSFIFLMCTTVFGFSSGDLLSQNIKIVVDANKIVTVDEVFEMIDKQTDYSFIYEPYLFKNLPEVHLKKGKVPINKLLQKSLSVGNFNIVVNKNNTIFIKEEQSKNPLSFQEMIEGKVIDAFETPLLGVNVVVKGTSRGVISDFDGDFSIDANVSDVLVFSFIGMLSQEIIITEENKNSIVVTMKSDILQLDEMVVTGTSVLTSKRQLGNAIATVQSKDIVNSASTEVTAALAGKFTGAVVSQNSGNPAGGISVTLRGASTVFGSSDPLYVIDGVLVDNSSVELLPLGGYQQNRLVDINPNDIDRIEIIKGAAAAAIYGSRASNGVVQIFTKKGIPGETQISFSYSSRINELRKQIEENQEPLQFEGPGSSVLVPAERFRMQDRIFRTGYGANYNLSLRGGNEDTQFFTSVSHTLNQGIIKNTDYKRYTLRANLDHKINDWLNISLHTNYAVSDSQELPNGGMLAPGEFFGVLTGFAFLNTNFNPERQEDGTYINPLPFTLAANPVAAIENYDFDTTTNRFIGGLRLEANPFRNFYIEYILGYDGSTTRATGFIPIGIEPKISGWSRVAERTALLLNNDLNFRYTTDITNNIKSVSSLGFTQQYDRSTIFAVTADRLSPSIRATTAGTIISRTDLREERSIRGGFFQQTFNFGEKFFLTGAIRLDQASTFGLDERTQFYPKASFSYVLSDENFWKNSLGNVFDTFKLRASYGEAGNLTALSAFDRLTNFNPIPIGGQTGFAPDLQAGNEQIRPERQREIEVGFDASLLDGRLGIEFSYYDVDVEDLLLSRVLAPSTGFSNRLENVGTLTNKGIEVLLKAQPIRTKDLTWNLLVNYSSNRNEVNDIEGGQLVLPDIFDQAVVAQNGQPIGVFSGTYFIRNENGEISTDANGIPLTSVDRKIIGDPNPDWTGSLINEVSYKNWRFRIQLDGAVGFDIFNFTDRLNSHTDLFGGGRRDAQEIRGELPRGYNAATFQTFERYIEDGTFVKIRELSLSHQFSFKNSNIIKDMTVSFIGRNLVSFDSYSGWDPETSSFGQRNGLKGLDFNEVPIPRTYQLGVNINF